MNLTLRPFIDSDAPAVASWVADERAMRLWSADRYGSFPVCGDDICRSYAAEVSAGGFRPFTLLDGDTPVGHVVMVRPQERPDAVRMVYTIVDPSRRGTGLGKTLLAMASEHAFGVLGASAVMIGVFECNTAARRCYEAAGFVPTGERFEMNCGAEGRRPCVMLERRVGR